MHRHSFTWVVAIVFLLVACSPNAVEEILPTGTVIPSATVTNAPATQTSTSVPATQTPAPPPALPTDWLSRLEIIRAENWIRLQLLKTFPAEMPLNHSAVAISPDGKTMAVGSSSNAQILFFDLANGQLSRAVPVTGVSNVDAYFNVMEYLSDGTLMANSSGPYAIYHIDPAGNVLSAWDGIGFAISADKRIMAHSTIEGITLLEIANDTPLSSLEGRDALDFSFSADGSKLAAAAVGVDFLNTVIWDIADQTRLITLMDTTNPRFSPDGKFLAVTSYEDDTIPFRIFSPDGANQLATVKVRAANNLNGFPPLWSADGSVITAQFAKGFPVAWETTNWQPLHAPALEGALYSFSPDGRILITRTDDGGILLWGVLP